MGDGEEQSPGAETRAAIEERCQQTRGGLVSLGRQTRVPSHEKRKRARASSKIPGVSSAEKRAALLRAIAIGGGSVGRARRTSADCRTSTRTMSVKTIAVIIAMEAEAAPLVEHLGLKKAEPSPFPGPLPPSCTAARWAAPPCTCARTAPREASAWTAWAPFPPRSPPLPYLPDPQARPPGQRRHRGRLQGQGRRHRRRLPRHRLQEPRQAHPHPRFRHLRHRRRRRRPAQPSRRHGLQGRRRLHRKLPRRPGVDLAAGIKANDASVKEMEAAGSAHVTTMFDIPFIAVKAITDIVDGG